ncbi:MAG: hypothetical protein IJV24_01945 [Prevotella sp.]|nr:hypothetical protein [Prevotella sp.]
MTAMLLERETNNYWELIKDASNEVKLALIKRLSEALMPAVATPKRRTRKPKAADFAGIWSDEDYIDADELVKLIRETRHFKKREVII